MARGRWLLPVLLIGACAGLGWLIYRHIWAAPSEPTLDGAAQTAPALPDLPQHADFSMPPAREFSAIVKRPLFSPTRQPAVEGVTDIGTSEPELDLTLVGVIISGEGRIALLKSSGTTGLLRLAKGDTYRGWSLDLIDPDRVIFRRGEVEEYIRISFEEPPPAQRPRQRTQPREQRNQSQPQSQQGND